MKKVVIKTYNILSALKETALSFGNLCIAITTSPYGSSMRRLEYEFQRLENERLKPRHEQTLSPKERRTLSSILSQLKAQNFIAVAKTPNTPQGLRITPQGMNYLATLEKKHSSIVVPRSEYPIKKGNGVILITFDIPEKQKYKRAWLREVLHILEFRMLQKSVWVGNTKLPKLFLEDLERCNLLPYLEIFAITKSGTLQNILAYPARTQKNN